MRRIWNITVAAVVAGAFMLAAVLCNSVHTLGKTGAQAACCSAKASKAPAAKDDCAGCPIALKSVDLTQGFVLAAPHAMPVVFASIIFKPVYTPLTPIFINGPPGPVSKIPLYIQSHSLRI